MPQLLLSQKRWSRRTRLGLITSVCVIALVSLFFMPMVPIGSQYHIFADTRTILGIQNALDVLSNIPFLVVGLWGLLWLLGKSSQRAALEPRARISYVVFFAGVALTGAGSYWYHLSPSNARLPWDLLPMTCSFMSMVDVTFVERVNAKSAIANLIVLLTLGIASVVYWDLSGPDGRGDYKFYLFVQFFSPMLLAVIVALFPPRYTGMRYLVIAFGFFTAAKAFEIFDFQIFGLGGIVSGHALKHVTAAVSCYWILRMLQVRRLLCGESTYTEDSSTSIPVESAR